MHRDGTAKAAGAFDPHPCHLVGGEHVDELGETPLGIRHLAAGQQPATVVDHRHREGVFVGVYSGDHVAPPIRCDRWAGDAQALWGGHTFVSPLAPSLYRASSPTITATRRQPLFRASPSLAGSIRSSRPGDVADPRTSQEQAEHPRVH